MNLQKFTKDKGRLLKEIEKQFKILKIRMSVSHPQLGNLEPNCYFMTAAFTQNSLISDPIKRLEYIRNLHEKLFMKIMGKTVKRYKLPKNRYKQTTSIDFYDFPGTQKGQGNTVLLPHIHSLLLIHPETVGRFEKARLEEFGVFNDPELRNKIQSLDFQEIKDRENLLKVIDYSSKFYRKPAFPFNEEQLHSLLYNCFGGQQASGKK
nr:hypothetical protein [Amylibacter sp.]